MIKRGQITLFIIIGVIIVVGLFLIFLFNSSGKDNIDKYFTSPEVKPQFDFLINSIQDCLLSTAGEAIDVISYQGGYYKSPANSIKTDFGFLPYYYNKGKITFPTKANIETELALYLDSNFDKCLNGISQDYFEVSYQKSTTKATISNGEVSFITDMDYKVQKDKKIATINTKKNPIVIKSKLNEMYEIAKYITDSHNENGEMMCVNCIADMAKEREVYVNMNNFDSDTTIITIYDNETSSYVYVYEFLNKY